MRPAVWLYHIIFPFRRRAQPARARRDCAVMGGCAEKIGTCSGDGHHCSQLTPVVLSRRYGIDEGYNQTHKLGGFAEILRVTFSGRYRSDGLDGPL